MSKQCNVELPKELLAAVARAIADEMERTAKSVKKSEVVGRALFLFLGSTENLGLKQALWTAKMEKARVKVLKKLGEKNIEVQLGPEDIANVIRQIRQSIEKSGGDLMQELV